MGTASALTVNAIACEAGESAMGSASLQSPRKFLLTAPAMCSIESRSASMVPFALRADANALSRKDANFCRGERMKSAPQMQTAPEEELVWEKDANAIRALNLW